MKKNRFRALVAATLMVLTGLANLPQKADGLASSYSEIVAPGSYAWIADIQSDCDPITKACGNGACTGSLIDALWVVTAANCVVPSGSVHPYAPSAITLRLAQVETHTAKAVFVLPGYLPGATSENDLALIKLDTPSKVAPIHPSSPYRSTDTDLSSNGRALFQAGFGLREGGAYDGKLRIASTTVSSSTSKSIFTGLWRNGFPARFSCGDRGSPIFGIHPNGQPRVMAVQDSKVYNPSGGCGTGSSAVRLDRANVYQWMESLIRPTHRPGAITQMPADGANGRYDSTGKLVTTQATKTNWGRGWTSVEYFRHAGRDYMIRYQEKAGTSDVWELDQATGVPTTRQFLGTWTSGWTSVKPYTVGGRTFLMLLKVGDGTTVVNEFVRNTNGTLKLSELQRKYWTPGWSAAEMFQAGGKPWMLLAKGSTGDVHIHQMAAATTGTWTHTANIGSGWETIRTFDVAGKPFVFLMDEETGTNQTRALNSDGSLGGVVQNGASPPGSTASFYKVNGATYIVRSGAGYANFVVRGIDASGKVGSKLQEAPEDFGNTKVQGYTLASGKTLAYFYKEGRL